MREKIALMLLLFIFMVMYVIVRLQFPPSHLQLEEEIEEIKKDTTDGK